MMEHLQKHIDELAKSMKVSMKQKPHMPGMMFVEFEPMYIEGPVIEKQKDYFVMLHELGHCFHGHTQGRPPYIDKTHYFTNGVLKSEAEAWEWALDNTLEEPTQETRQFMWSVCLGSYYQSSIARAGRSYRLGNGDRHYVEFVFDKPDIYFWKIKRRILGKH